MNPVKHRHYHWPDDNEELLTLTEKMKNLKLSKILQYRGKPHGNDNGSMNIIKKFGLESTIRLPWRPKKGL